MSEGDESKRDIWVLGFRESDERPDSALARVFGLDATRARRLIASMPAVVKRDVSPEAAEPILRALRKIGARVALVPSGASTPPARGMSSMPPRPEPQPEPELEGESLGDIASRDIDFGQGPPSPGPAEGRGSLPQPRLSAPASPPPEAAPPSAPAAPPPPAAPAFLDAIAIPADPEPPGRRSSRLAAAIGVVLLLAGIGALGVAAGLSGNIFGDGQPTLGSAAAVGGSLALGLFGLQLFAGALLFDVTIPAPMAAAAALVLGCAVASAGYALHRVDPVELERRERVATMSAIGEGLLPEARVFLGRPRASLRSMDRPTAVAFVERLYDAGARQVYVVVDYEGAPDEGRGLAINMPLTTARRLAVESALRSQVAGAPPAADEWWLVSLE